MKYLTARTRRFRPSQHRSPAAMDALEPRILFSAANATAPIASKLVFVQQPPATIIAGARLPVPVIVEVEDQFGNLMKTNHSKIKLSFVDQTASPLFATDSGALPIIEAKALSARLKGGFATFNTIPSFVAGSSGPLEADDGALNAQSTVLTITPAAPKHLWFEFLPQRRAPHDTYGIWVVVLDKFNNLVTTDNAMIGLRFTAHPSGTARIHESVGAVQSIAQFAVAFSKAGRYRLRATARGFAPITSAPLILV